MRPVAAAGRRRASAGGCGARPGSFGWFPRGERHGRRTVLHSVSLLHLQLVALRHQEVDPRAEFDEPHRLTPVHVISFFQITDHPPSKQAGDLPYPDHVAVLTAD